MKKMALFLTLLSQLYGCGSKNVDKSESQIVNGTSENILDSVKKSTVAIMRDGTAVCTGVIVAPRTVLTAQHCFIHEPSQDSYEIGYSESGIQNNMEKRKVAEMHFYATDTAGNPIRKFLPLGDITLLKWKGDNFKGSEPAQLADDDFVMPSGAELLIAGYGSSSVYDGAPSQHLKQGSTFVQKAYLNGPFRGLLTFGGGPDGSCYGDSGGPAFVKGPQGYRLVGLTQGINPSVNDDADFLSTNDSCALKVGTYTLVSFYGLWLKELGVPLKGVYRRTLDQEIATFQDASEICSSEDISLQNSYNIRRFLLRLRLGSDCEALLSRIHEVKEITFNWEGPSDLALLRFMPKLQSLALHNLQDQVSLHGLEHHPGLENLSLNGTLSVQRQEALSSLSRLKHFSWLNERPLFPGQYAEGNIQAFQNLPDSLEVLELSRIQIHRLNRLPKSLTKLKVTGAALQGNINLAQAPNLQDVDLSHNLLKSVRGVDRLKHFIVSANLLDAVPQVFTDDALVIFDENPFLSDGGIFE